MCIRDRNKEVVSIDRCPIFLLPFLRPYTILVLSYIDVGRGRLRRRRSSPPRSALVADRSKLVASMHARLGTDPIIALILEQDVVCSPPYYTRHFYIVYISHSKMHHRGRRPCTAMSSAYIPNRISEPHPPLRILPPPTSLTQKTPYRSKATI